MSNKPGRNDPCPCGSGKKFKKCCEAKYEVEARAQNQINQQAHDPGMHALLQRLRDYAAPLMPDKPNATEIKRAMTLASTFWEIASIQDDAQREARVEALVAGAPEDQRSNLRDITHQMIERQWQMFPDFDGDTAAQ